MTGCLLLPLHLLDGWGAESEHAVNNGRLSVMQHECPF